MRLHSLKAVLLICLAWPAMGGTRIQDTVYYAANGEPAEGQVTISWPSFKSGSRTVVASRMVFQLTAGALSVDLEPNDAGIPAGTSYAVSYQLKAGVRSAECWVVPTSATPVTIAAVRVAVIPTPAVTVSLTQLLQGGATVGQCVGWNGTAWAPAVCGTVTSVFGRTGAVTAAAGDYAGSGVTNTPAGNIAAVTVQAAIDELDGEKSATGHGHAATAIANTPAGNIAAVTVQAAIDELDGEKSATGHQHSLSDDLPELAIRSSVVDLTAAQVKALNTTAIQIAPAPGAGKLIMPMTVTTILNFGTVAFSGGSNTVTFIYNTSGFVYVPAGAGPDAYQGFCGGVWTSSTDVVCNWGHALGVDALRTVVGSTSGGISGTTLTNRVNKPVSVINPTANFTAGDSVVRIIMRYYVLNLGL